MICVSDLMSQAAPKPYYPGFRDLNLWFVGLCLLVLLYAIAVAATAQRVRLAKSKLREIDVLLANSAITEEQRRNLESDRRATTEDFESLTAAGPGRWFRKR